jgi:hypothetical protein
LVKAPNLPFSPEDVFEHGLSLSTVWVSHAAQIRNAEHANHITLANGPTVNVLDTGGELKGHGT